MLWPACGKARANASAIILARCLYPIEVKCIPSFMYHFVFTSAAQLKTRMFGYARTR